MKAKTWRVAGLVMALMGALTVANAERGDRGGEGCDHDRGHGHKKEGEKGKDGRPSREEMRQKYDKDGDGKLSEEERAALREDMEKRHGKRGGERPSREEITEKYDADGDGELSEEERAALREDMEKRHGKRSPREEIMEKFDTDGDGELSDDERAAMRKAFEERRREREQQGE